MIANEKRSGMWKLMLAFLCLAATLSMAENNTVMGSVQFQGKTKVDKTSGVWVDGQYVGYLKELKGTKKVMLLPGDHSIVVRQNGYTDYTQTVTIQPGQTNVVQVAMMKGVSGAMPKQTATVKVDIKPDRAAVFVDGQFAGHAGEFSGVGKAMLVAPGAHHIRVALPGYNSFETDINPLANQKVEVKTELAKSGDPLPDPMLKEGAAQSDSNGPAQPAPPPQQ